MKKARSGTGLVGRAPELALFEEVLADSSPRRGLLLHGPGGVGKTVLLNECVRRTGEHGLEVVKLDAAQVGLSGDAFTAALCRGFDVERPDDLFDTLAERPAAVAIDSLEFVGTLEDWLVEELLGRLPPQTLILLAGRRLLGAKARARLGWLTAVQPLALRNFDRETSRAYLSRVNVPPRLADSLYRLTRGHPLALALAGEFARTPGAFAPGPITVSRLESLALDDVPHLVPELLAQWIRDLPAAGSIRDGLYVCALAWTTNHGVLRIALGAPDEEVAQVYDWLQARSFVELTPDGLVPHQIVRETLVADLRYRDPARYLRLTRGLANHLAESLHGAPPWDVARIISNFTFLIHSAAGWTGFVDREGFNLTEPMPATEIDWAEVERMVEQFEGPESVRLLRAWHAAGAEAFVIRTEEGVRGFTVELRLDRASRDLVDEDPITRVIWQTLRDQGLSAEAPVMLHRFWAHRESYQAVSPTHTRIALFYQARFLKLEPALGAFVVRASPHWDLLVEHTPIDRLCGNCEVGGHRYDVLCDDLRGTSRSEYVRQHIPIALGDAPEPSGQHVVMALPRQEFARSVAQALEDLEHPQRLAANPLARSRFVDDLVSSAPDLSDRARTLATTIRERRSAVGPSLERLIDELWRLDGGSATADAGERPTRPERAHLERDGDLWSIGFRGARFYLKHTKGLGYLHHLLHRPRVPVLALELASGAEVRSNGELANLEQDLVDTRALAAYRERLAELGAELSQAEQANDVGRIERLQNEMEAVRGQVTASVGLGGRTRRFASAAERARVNVTAAIRTAQRNIERHSPALAQHVANCVRTGRFCSYEPEPGREIVWLERQTVSGTR